MLADAAHSLGDLVSDVVTIVAVRFARRPTDTAHPYGYGKFEPLGALGVGGLLVATGVGIGHHAWEHLTDPTSPSDVALWVAVASLVVKEAMFQWTVAVGKQQNSDLLVANAWHHRSDAISSLLALVGIAGAKLGVPMLDPVAGLVVSGLIIKMGLSACLDSLKELSDRLEEDTVESIRAVLKGVPEVLGFHDIRTRKMGPYSVADLHIQVDRTLSVSAAQQVAERVRNAILEKLPRVSDVLVHVDAEPHCDHPHPMRPQAAIEADVRQALHSVPGVTDVSHVVCHYLNNSLNLEVTVRLNVHPDERVETVYDAGRRAKQALETIPDVRYADVHLELIPPETHVKH